MTHENFNALVESRMEKLQTMLTRKTAEYSVDTDRLHNFTCASGLLKTTKAKAAWGMAVKHIVSVTDMVNGKPFNSETLDEKITDAMAYLLLVEACLVEELKCK